MKLYRGPVGEISIPTTKRSLSSARRWEFPDRPCRRCESLLNCTCDVLKSQRPPRWCQKFFETVFILPHMIKMMHLSCILSTRARDAYCHNKRIYCRDSRVQSRTRAFALCILILECFDSCWVSCPYRRLWCNFCDKLSRATDQMRFTHFSCDLVRRFVKNVLVCLSLADTQSAIVFMRFVMGV